MSTSWRSPFPTLPAPHTTPASANPKSLRRPIHNPYDKFTKPEFDEWISGITGALRRALGEEAEEDVALDEHHSQDAYPSAEETFQDQSFEDSFADIQSGRAKGKLKDPREGPGLGAPQNPIELLSDSQSGSEVGSDEYDDESVHSEEECDDYTEREREGFDVDAERDVYDSHDQAGHWAPSGRHGPVHTQLENDGGEEISFREESPEILEIGSDGEGDTRASVHRAGYSAAQYDRSPQLPPDEVEDELGPVGAAVNEEEGQLDAEVKDFPPYTTRRQSSPPLELPDPWQGPRTYAEDFYAGGDFSAEDTLNGVSPSNLTPVHDHGAHLDTYFSQSAQNVESSPAEPKAGPVVVKVDVADDALPDSSPPPSSPVEGCSCHIRVDDFQLSNLRSTHEEPDNILDHLYRDAVHMSQDEQMVLNSSFDEFDSGATSTSHAYTQPVEHLDWNWPPAFPRGKFASRAGHLESSPSRAGSDDVEETRIEDIIDVDAKLEDEDGSDGISEGPIPLGTSDLVYDDNVLQEGQDEHSNDRNGLYENLVEGDDRRFSLPGPLESRLNADECAAMESFFDLLNSREVPPAVAIGHVETTLADISGMVTEHVGEDVTRLQDIEEAGDTDLISVPAEALELVDEESQASYATESSVLIEEIKAPTAEFQNQAENVASENVEESPLPFVEPTATLGDAPVLTEESLDGPDATPIYVVVEMDPAVPISRGVSEGIEVKSFAGEVPDFDGDYVVEEPRTAEISVEPDDLVDITVDMLVETVPVTPKPAPAELSPSDNHNASPFPMPIFGDPSALDPIVSSEAKHLQQTPPRLANIPGTPRIILSPHPSPGQPIPVSVSVSTSMLHAFSRRVSPSEGSSGPSGLFTPREGELTSGNTGDAFGTPSPHAGLLPLSADDVLASVATALADEPGVEIDTPTIDVSENVLVSEQSPAGLSTGDRQDDSYDPTEDTHHTHLDVFHSSSADGTAKENNQNSSPEPDVEQLLVEEDSKVTSLEAEQAVSTIPTVVDQGDSSGDDHPEEAPLPTEALPTVPGLAHSSPLLGHSIDQDPFLLVEPDVQVPPGSVAEEGNWEDTVSQRGLGNFPDVLGRSHESPAVNESDRSRNADDQGSQTKPLKRKRISSLQPSSRLTRSMSGRISAGNKKSQGGNKAERGVPVRGQKRKPLDVRDSASDTGSVSSGASSAVRMLQFASTDGSRASSVMSTAPSDSSSIQRPLVPPPFFHAHGANHHRHGPPVPPPAPIQTRVHIKAASPEPSHDPEGRKDSPSISTAIRTPSVQRIPASTSSPVTRSNCRFHKISLPKEEGGPRVCFVVPGCSLGDKELMDEEEILDHGPATHEDYSRLVGNIEALDLNPYLIGVLRQLVGVDLIRENEVFYLLQPGEEAHYKKKKSRKSAAGSKLASSTMARSAPTSPQISVASRHSPFTSISRPPVSTAGSMATSFGSSLSEVPSYRHSSLFSTSGEELSDEEGTASPKSKRRRKEPVVDTVVPADEEAGNVSQDLESKGPQVSARILQWSGSRRQVARLSGPRFRSEAAHASDGGADGLDKDWRKAKKTKGKKRPRAADEEQNSQAKRQKQKQVHDE